MRKQIILVILLLPSINSFAQKLNFEDLVYLIEHNCELSDTYLAKNGFKFSEVRDESFLDDKIKCTTTEWAYDKNIKNNLASAFIIKTCSCICDPTIDNRQEKLNENIFYQIYFRDGNMVFEEIKDYCKSNGYKLIKSEKNSSDEMCFTFTSKKYEFNFCSGINSKVNYNEYSISINKL